LEGLTHIRNWIKARPGRRGRLHSRPFGELRRFLAYKVQLDGVLQL
jgi:hypothetical protein